MRPPANEQLGRGAARDDAPPSTLPPSALIASLPSSKCSPHPFYPFVFYPSPPLLAAGRMPAPEDAGNSASRASHQTTKKKKRTKKSKAPADPLDEIQEFEFDEDDLMDLNSRMGKWKTMKKGERLKEVKRAAMAIAAHRGVANPTEFAGPLLKVCQMCYVVSSS